VTNANESVTLKRTSLNQEHATRGGRLVDFAGWEMPIQFSGINDEHRTVRSAAGLFDASHMGELELSGEHALEVANYLITNDLTRIEDGQALYTCCLNEQGTILDDLIVYRRSLTSVMVVCNASNLDKIRAHFKKACENHCTFEDVSAKTALIALQGPKSFEILARLGTDGASCSELKSFRFATKDLAGVQSLVSRTGYTGEDGVEIFCPWDDAPTLWRALLEHGADLGIKPAGLGARDTLRLEARLSLYGNDIDETTNPIEAGLSWVVKMDKPLFVGKDALLKIKEDGLKRKMVGFEMVGRGIARHGYSICDEDGEEMGICTSGGPAPSLNKNIGLGYVPLDHSEIGQTIWVDCRGRMIEARVVKPPFYKRPA
jgi:aminomethyltransferase